MAKRERSQSPMISHKRQASTVSSTASCSSEDTSTRSSEYGYLHSSPLASPIGVPPANLDGNRRPRSEQPAATTSPSEEDFSGDSSNFAGSETHKIKKAASTPPTATGNRTRQNGLQTPLPMTPDSNTAADTFPIFRMGNIFIECNLVTPPRRWQLHGANLERHSAWFRQAIQENSQDSSQQISRSFLLSEGRGGQLALRSARSAASREKILEVTTARLPTPPPSTTSDHFPSLVFSCAAEIELFNQLFGAFYSIPLTIPTTSVSATLSTCDSLLRISNHLSITPLIATQLSTALKSHRHDLYIAISRDPARYLLLSIHLRDTAIYTESLIHIVGAFPSWPKHWTTRLNVLPDGMRAIIERKSAELHALVTETKYDLLTLTIHMHSSCPPNPLNNAEFDTWFIVNYFRNTLANEMNALRNLRRGEWFRKIAKGGDAYMPLVEVRKEMEAVMPSVLGNLEEDLNMLKVSAVERVEDVVRNRALVDVEKEGIGWLTCVEIGVGDVLWEVEGEGEGGGA